MEQPRLSDGSMQASESPDGKSVVSTPTTSGGGGGATRSTPHANRGVWRRSSSLDLTTTTTTSAAAPPPLSLATAVPPLSAGGVAALLPTSPALGSTTVASRPPAGPGGAYILDSQIDEISAVCTFPTSFTGPVYTSMLRDSPYFPLIDDQQYLIMMVGLPARGKTFLAQKLCRWLNWQGTKAQLHNVSGIWRAMLARPLRSADFDLYSDPTKMQQYKRALDAAVEEMIHFLGPLRGSVAICNDEFFGDVDLRTYIVRLMRERCPRLRVFYIEVIRDSDKNATFEHSKCSDAGEYGDISGTAEASFDFCARLEILQKHYESVASPDAFMRIINGSHSEVHGIRGFLPSRVVAFLLNLAPKKGSFPIYFSRHGQSGYNLEDRLGGNSELTPKGHQDAQYLKEFIRGILDEEEARYQAALAAADTSDSAASSASASGSPTSATTCGGLSPKKSFRGLPERRKVEIWTSQLTRTIQTGAPAEHEFGLKCIRWRALNEIHAGICENLTYDDIKRVYPLIHELRGKNKFSFRYPEGESYQDLVQRLEEVITELENANKIVVVIAHQAVLRALLAYFGQSPAERSVHVDVPHRTVWRCQVGANGNTSVDEMKLGPEEAGGGD